MSQKTERLQTVLSHRGVASRRHAAGIIDQGRVTVNGQTVRIPGYRVTPDVDLITVDGSALPAATEPKRTLMLNKPPGCSTTLADDQGPSVMRYMQGVAERVVPIGRLDKESEGLLLFSNDGDLINRLTHPRHGHTKRYEVEVRGRVTPAVLRRLGEPIEINGAMTRPARVRRVGGSGGSHTLEFTLGEGRNRQIRRLCRRARLDVLRLKRTAIGALQLGDLQPGQFRELSEKDIRAAQTR